MSPPWMPFYVNDYIGDTLHLSTLEHGAYMLLLLHYWQHEGLPESEDELLIITRLQPKEWKKMMPKIARFFTPGWRHKRVDAELVRAADRYERRSQAGKAGGIAKAARLANDKQCSSNATSETVAMRKQSSTNSLPTTTTPLRESRTVKPGTPSQDCGDRPAGQALAPVAGWDDYNPFGTDDDGEAAA